MTSAKLNPRERLRVLAAFVPRFEAPGASIGDWVPPEDQGDVIVVGWFRFNELGEAFLEACGRGSWVKPFDWMRWLGTDEGRRLMQPGPDVDAATPIQLQRILTAIVRSERFGDGSVEAAFRSGLLTAVARRAAVLAEA